jgi:hypothetical protein
MIDTNEFIKILENKSEDPKISKETKEKILLALLEREFTGPSTILNELKAKYEQGLTDPFK